MHSNAEHPGGTTQAVTLARALSEGATLIDYRRTLRSLIYESDPFERPLRVLGQNCILAGG